MAQTFKAEILQAGHCFNGTVATTGTAGNGVTAITGIAAGAGISVGMAISGTGIAAGSVVSAIVSTTAVTSSLNTTAVITAGALTFTGDLYKMALFAATPNGQYDGSQAGSQNYVGMGSDEVTGTGYTAAGNLLINVTPSVNTGQGITTFSVNPSWTTATFSTSGCMIYNTSARVISTTTVGKAAAVYYFGLQTVSSGTFTVVMPTAAANTSILQIR
jgi:F0F1-type ATP synthase membrane subunit c/vacuolar-type H+-ATPase subunit K